MLRYQVSIMNLKSSVCRHINEQMTWNDIDFLINAGKQSKAQYSMLKRALWIYQEDKLQHLSTIQVTWEKRLQAMLGEWK